LIVCFVILACLAAFYAWTLLRGAGGSRVWNPGIGNVLLSFYEFAGFSGLGPARQVLRDAARAGTGGLKSAVAPYLVALGSLAVLYVIVLARGFRSGALRTPLGLSLLTSITLSIGGLVAASLVVCWPFWGRHLSPIFPFFVLVVAIALSGAPGRSPHWIALVLSVTLFCSCLQLRFFPRHAKDDYRSAAAIASVALREGASVWWAADMVAAQYYGLPLSENGPRIGGALAVMNPAREFVSTHEAPAVLVLSKPDVYDGEGALRELAANRYRLLRELPAFRIYGRR
jgi:hypothetical protein